MHPLDAISIGVPGPVINNVMQGSKPLNILEDVNFAEALQEFQQVLCVKNDLDMAVLCELHRGIGLKHKSFCLVSLSTGIGVAVVNNGSVLEGRIEMGHQVFSPNFEPAQECTKHKNCWLSLASGSGIEKRFGTKEHTTTETLFQQVLTAEQISELQSFNAQGLGNLVNAYDPEVIVMMGSLAIKQFEQIIPNAQAMEMYTLNRPIPPVIKSQYADEIGVLGGYHAAVQALKRNA